MSVDFHDTPVLTGPAIDAVKPNAQGKYTPEPGPACSRLLIAQHRDLLGMSVRHTLARLYADDGFK